MTDNNTQTIKVFTFKESGKYYDEFEISVAPEIDEWYYVIEAVRYYKKTATKQKDMDWLIGINQSINKVSHRVYNSIYPIILKG